MSTGRFQEIETQDQGNEADDGFESYGTRVSEINLSTDHPALSKLLSARDDRKEPPLLKVRPKSNPGARSPKREVHQEFTDELIDSLPSIAEMMQQRKVNERSRGMAIILAGMASGGLLGGIFYLLMVGL